MTRKTYDISAYKPLRPSTRVMVAVLRDGEWQYTEAAKIVRWAAKMGQRNHLPAGYEPVRFDDTGGTLMIHRDSFKVVDNRP